MYYSLTGSNKKRRAMLDKAIQLAYQKLDIGDDYWIYIEISRKRLDEDAYGWCLYDKEWGRMKRINIQLWGQLADDWLVSALFHELKHAEQYAKGYLNPQTDTWKGKDYSNSTAYVSAPWEVAANRFEQTMYKRWENAQSR